LCDDDGHARARRSFRAKREHAWLVLRRRLCYLICELEPLDVTLTPRAANVVRVRLRRPETIPTLAFDEIRQERGARGILERLLRPGTADEMHERYRTR